MEHRSDFEIHLIEFRDFSYICMTLKHVFIPKTLKKSISNSLSENDFTALFKIPQMKKGYGRFYMKNTSADEPL